MSSTNRSNSRDNHIADYYVTPIDKISDFLEEFEKVETIDKNIKILDCCAGGDGIEKDDKWFEYSKRRFEL